MSEFEESSVTKLSSLQHAISPDRTAPGLRAAAPAHVGSGMTALGSPAAKRPARRRESVDDQAGRRFRFKDLVGHNEETFAATAITQAARRKLQSAGDENPCDALANQLAACLPGDKTKKLKGADAMRRLSVRRMSIGSEMQASLERQAPKGGASVSGPEARSRARAQSLRKILEIIGERILLAPDELLASEGSTQQGNDAIYVVLRGSLVATSSDGAPARTYGEGTVLNDDCYMLGAKPEETLRAAPRRIWSGDDSFSGSFARRRNSQKVQLPAAAPVPGQAEAASVLEAAAAAAVLSQDPLSNCGRHAPSSDNISNGEAVTEVTRLRFDRTAELIASEPHLMRLFYGTLAADLSERLAMQSISIRAAARSLSTLHAHDTMDDESPVRLRDRTANEIARDFQLPGWDMLDDESEDDPMSSSVSAGDFALLASSECSASIESNLRLEWDDSPASIYVLNTHVCVERVVAWFIVERRSFPLADVFAVLGRTRNGRPSSTSGASNGSILGSTVGSLFGAKDSRNGSFIDANGRNGSFIDAHGRSGSFTDLNGPNGSFIDPLSPRVRRKSSFTDDNDRHSTTRISRLSELGAGLVGLEATQASNETRPARRSSHPGVRPTAQEPVVSIQMRGASLTIALPKEAVGPVVGEIEAARLAATDSSNLRGAFGADPKGRVEALRAEAADSPSHSPQAGSPTHSPQAASTVGAADFASIVDGGKSFSSASLSFSAAIDGKPNAPPNITAGLGDISEQLDRAHEKKRRGSDNSSTSVVSRVSFADEACEASPSSPLRFQHRAWSQESATSQVSTTSLVSTAPADAIPGIGSPMRRKRGSFTSSGSGFTPRLTEMGMISKLIGRGTLPKREVTMGFLRPDDVLHEDVWSQTLKMGARFRTYKRGQVAVQIGKAPDGLMQVVRGVFRIELEEPDRPQALVLQRVEAGDIIGESWLLLGTAAPVRVVCDSDRAMVARMPLAFMERTFDADPAIAGRFFCVLAMSQAARLAKQEAEGVESIEVRIADGANVPRTMDAIVANPAFFLILHKFVLKANYQQRATGASKSTLSSAFEFIQTARAMRTQANATELLHSVLKLYSRYLALDAPRALDAFSSTLRNELAQKVEGAPAMTPSQLRHVYDVPIQVCMRMVEDACFSAFLQSRHYQYVLALKSKEFIVPTVDFFKVTRMLGEGAFGQVLEVVKRDCGQKYAMKVQDKALLVERLGEDNWERCALDELRIMRALHHPLLVNLAYAFQTIEHLVLVMDACPYGDLCKFIRRFDEYKYSDAELATMTPVSLDAKQIRFVAMELVAVVAYLHSQAVLYRDMKPDNVLLDARGHVRLIDFGISAQGDPKSGVPPESHELCGTVGYMAPEIMKARRRNYGGACDWFALGVVLYELHEHVLPFGKEPVFEDVRREYVQPDLIDPATGDEVPHLYEMLAGLLDWNPNGRLVGDALKAHSYWMDVDWELADRRTMPSPLLEVLGNVGAGSGSGGKRSQTWIQAVNEPSSKHQTRIHDGAAASKWSIDNKAVHLADQLASSQADHHLVEKRNDVATYPSLAESSLVERLEKREVQMNVAGWEFVSEQALAAEYVATVQDSFSVA